MNITTISSNRSVRRGFAASIVGAALLAVGACGTAGTDAVGAGVDTTDWPRTFVPSGPEPTPTTTPPWVASTTHTPTTTVASTSTAAPATSTTLSDEPPRPAAALDQIIPVRGTGMHIRCSGRGDTTVLLIAGFEAGADGWAVVEPALTPSTRVCSYDRPGTGASDPAVATQTFATQARDLHELLTAAGEPGPYVVVGHSMGGGEAVLFASEYDDEVSGLVLVDASPVTWPAAICAVADDGTDAARFLLGLCSTSFVPSGNAERLDVVRASAGAAGVTSLGSLPMSVITAVDREVPDGLAAEERARLTDVWDRGQQQWSLLSTAGRVVSVDETGHYIQLDRPEVVIDAITNLLP
jgi:pimeloyl-ACP methyl ester carboxylesterase